MSPMTMRRLRQVHQYLGMFFAPAIIFFAFSGALQTFSLHENHGGGPYKPPGWIVAIASLHKDQTLPHPEPDHGPRADAHGDPDGDHGAGGPHGGGPDKGRPSPLPLKIFVLGLAIGLGASTALGIFIGLRSTASKRGSLIALALGVALPAALIWL